MPETTATNPPTPRAHPNRPAPCAAAANLLAQAATLILQAFAAFVFARFHILGTPTGKALHARIARATRRLQHLLALAAQGREPRAYTPRPSRPRPAARPRPILPRRRGWGCDMLGYQGNGFGLQLQRLLTQPDTIALLRACPARTRLAAARAVRPLLHMFAWDLPDVLQQAGPPRPRRRRVPKPRPIPTTNGGKYPRLNPFTYSPGRIPGFKTGRE